MPANLTASPIPPQLSKDQIAALATLAQIMADVGLRTLDLLGGDPHLEDGGDEGDAAWIEWDQMRGAQKPGPNVAGPDEDDEVDDEDCSCGEDDPDFRALPKIIQRHLGAGCLISDSDRVDEI